MRVVSLILLVAVSLMALACTGTAPEPTPSLTPEPTAAPTPDIEATVEAGISATREAETSAAATIEAQVAATLAVPTATPTPAPTPILAPTATPRPTATFTPQATPTPQTTEMPYPTPTADEEERLIASLYRCFQIPEFVELVAEDVGVPQDLMEPLLEDWESFHAIMSLAIREDPQMIEEFRETEAIFSVMCGNDGMDDGTTSGQSTPTDDEERLIKAMYNCIQTSPQYREAFLSGVEGEGLTTEMMSPFLEDYDAFLAMMLIGFQEDPASAELLIPLTPILEADCGALSTP